MNKQIILGISLVVGIFVTIFVIMDLNNPQTTELSENKTKLNIKSLFDIYGSEENFELRNDEKIWHHVEFKLNSENSEIYNELRNDEKGTVVVFPIFTAAAYNEPGFYTYFREECDKECLTVELKESYPPIFASSGNAFQVLSLLGYQIISDIQIDKNPKILDEYSKVILLHNEYVTKKEFDAITSHPNVIYLYPNALYAEVEFDYETNSITLLRGHNFPESNIFNGFDWKYDNSNLEYNTTCNDMGFDRIDNGLMLNCYPESAIHKSKILLKMIKDF